MQRKITVFIHDWSVPGGFHLGAPKFRTLQEWVQTVQTLQECLCLSLCPMSVVNHVKSNKLHALAWRILEWILKLLRQTGATLATILWQRSPFHIFPSMDVLRCVHIIANLIDTLTGLRCDHSHEHQVIEGQVRHRGQLVNRSTFTEIYPRKFARRLAKCFGKF